MNHEAIDAFRGAIAAAGLEPPAEIIGDGALHRFASNGRRGDDSGWYVAHMDDMPAGAFGCWRAGVSETWTHRNGREYTPAQKAEFRARIEAAQRLRTADEARRHDEAAQRAERLFAESRPADPGHPYLLGKNIGPNGARQTGDDLVVPVRIGGALRSVQTIKPEGSKRFLTGGEVAGGYYSIGGKPMNALLIAEGFATGASLRECTGYPVAVAFNAGNLESVALALRQRHQGIKLVICADDDYRTDGNPGITKATAAARAVGGLIAVPDFGDDRPDGATDFNDLHQARGPEAVRAAVEHARAPDVVRDGQNAEGDDEGEPGLSVEDELARLAGLTRIEYDRERKAVADRLGLRLQTLDEAVEARRPTGTEDDSDDTVEELEPWPEPVNGLTVLDAIRADFERYVVADPENLDACALWSLGTYCYDAFPVWPKLFVSSPERRCGKTVTLEVLEANASRGLMASSITSSAIFRAVNAWRPTLIVDEADTFGKDDEELAGIINAGHRKRSAVVVRNVKVGDEYLPKKFSVWAPMAIAAIGRLRDTVMDRSVIVHMRRKASGEASEKIPPDLFAINHARRRKCLRWAEDNLDTLRGLRISMPPHGNDRALDNWAPLFAIADRVGGYWPTQARTAFAKLAAEEEEESIGPMLLSDIREVFEEKRYKVISSQELVEALAALDDRPWCEWRRGKAMTQNSLARLLKPFRIHPRNHRLGTVVKGYELKQFEDAFDRYLAPTPQRPPNQPATPLHPNNDAGSGDFQTATSEPPVAVAKSPKPLSDEPCSGVADEKGGTAGVVEYI